MEGWEQTGRTVDVTAGAEPGPAEEYRRRGWWGDVTISQRVRELAAERPDDPAYVDATGTLSWAGYDQWATGLADVIGGLGLAARSRVAVMLPDGPTVHVALVALERAGMVAVGIGARAGDREIAHLLRLTGARALLCHHDLRGRDADELRHTLRRDGVDLAHVIVVPPVPVDSARSDEVEILDGDANALRWERASSASERSDVEDDRSIGPDELFLLNSTSGTTGMPKCVAHTQNRWFYFHQLAASTGQLASDEVVLGAVPAPFGFGLWTAHFTPTILGVPTIVMDRFDADTALDLVEQHRVTMLCAVSTQFIMMLNAQAEQPRDLTSLRTLFTGGEAVPYERAAEFEKATGARVLQFYGSNETGALSATTVEDDRDQRLRTAGRVLGDMDVRLFNPDTGAEVTEAGVPGVPACRGPATCLGYWGDDDANAQLFTEDGWMLMGDIVEIDPDGYLTVVGRTSDFIIRGGKNISAPAVEAEVGTLPGIAMVAAVAMADPVFGERVCVYVVARPGATVTLADIVAHLKARGVSSEWLPERLELVDDLPRSSGGKVAKGELRADLERRIAADAETDTGAQSREPTRVGPPAASDQGGSHP